MLNWYSLLHKTCFLRSLTKSKAFLFPFRHSSTLKSVFKQKKTIKIDGDKYGNMVSTLCDRNNPDDILLPAKNELQGAI